MAKITPTAVQRVAQGTAPAPPSLPDVIAASAYAYKMIPYEVRKQVEASSATEMGSVAERANATNGAAGSPEGKAAALLAQLRNVAQTNPKALEDSYGALQVMKQAALSKLPEGDSRRTGVGVEFGQAEALLDELQQLTPAATARREKEADETQTRRKKEAAAIKDTNARAAKTLFPSDPRAEQLYLKSKSIGPDGSRTALTAEETTELNAAYASRAARAASAAPVTAGSRKDLASADHWYTKAAAQRQEMTRAIGQGPAAADSAFPERFVYDPREAQDLRSSLEFKNFAFTKVHQAGYQLELEGNNQTFLLNTNATKGSSGEFEDPLGNTVFAVVPVESRTKPGEMTVRYVPLTGEEVQGMRRQVQKTLEGGQVKSGMDEKQFGRLSRVFGADGRGSATLEDAAAHDNVPLAFR